MAKSLQKKRNKSGTARSPYGMVSTASDTATMAGVGILEKGGNAVDAAVAAAFKPFFLGRQPGEAVKKDQRRLETALWGRVQPAAFGGWRDPARNPGHLRLRTGQPGYVYPPMSGSTGENCCRGFCF